MLSIDEAMNAAHRETLDPQPAGTRIVPKIGSEQLMKGKGEIIVQHGPEEYRLRITATGKLILTKFRGPSARALSIEPANRAGGAGRASNGADGGKDQSGDVRSDAIFLKLLQSAWNRCKGKTLIGLADDEPADIGRPGARLAQTIIAREIRLFGRALVERPRTVVPAVGRPAP